MEPLCACVRDLVEYIIGSARCGEADAPYGPMQATRSDRGKNRGNYITHVFSVLCIAVERGGFSTPKGLGPTLMLEEEKICLTSEQRFSPFSRVRRRKKVTSTPYFRTSFCCFDRWIWNRSVRRGEDRRCV
jgi:hypothetical protein